MSATNSTTNKLHPQQLSSSTLPSRQPQKQPLRQRQQPLQQQQQQQQPMIRLELPGKLKSLEDLHARSPYLRRPQRHTHQRRRSPFGDGIILHESSLTCCSGDSASSVSSSPLHEQRRRKPSLTPEEAYILRRLLLDDDDDNNNNNNNDEAREDGSSLLSNRSVLNDEILFSIPPSLVTSTAQTATASTTTLRTTNTKAIEKLKNSNVRHPIPSCRRHSIKGLWKAHAAGVPPKELLRNNQQHQQKQKEKEHDENGGGRGDGLDFPPSPYLSRTLSEPRSYPTTTSNSNSTAPPVLLQHPTQAKPIPQHPQEQQPQQQALVRPPRPPTKTEDNRGSSSSALITDTVDSNATTTTGVDGSKVDYLHRCRSGSINDDHTRRFSHRRSKSDSLHPELQSSRSSSLSLDYDDFYPSDQEVRPRNHHKTKKGDAVCSKDNHDDDDDDDDDGGSSWGDDEHLEHFDAWEILRDEYASDFGFETHVNPSKSFRILGTSADDAAAQPHVLSPPLMDALMSHLPEQVRGDNYWLKFSLVRDGANLDTLKRYVRSSQYTILAIETDRGQVFGSFTSAPWRNNFGFFGKAPAFVWRMQKSRQTKCASLLEQAQLESQIDVYPYCNPGMYSGNNHSDRLVQVCRHDLLAVGGDDCCYDDDPCCLDDGNNSSNSHMAGFAIALDDDLLRGTTSPCQTFRSPALLSDVSGAATGSDSSTASGDNVSINNDDHNMKSHVFYTSGLEVWTLTPARDVDAAEKLEMSKFFIEESTRTLSTTSVNSLRGSSWSGSITSPLNSPRPSMHAGGNTSTRGNNHNANVRWGSQELIQEEFFRRVGHDSESEERREIWQYRNMMDGTGARNSSVSRGIGSSPRFGYEHE